MRVWEGLVARHQRRTALKIRRAAEKLSGLDTALRLCPEWYDNEEECSTCRKRRRRLQAAPHTLAQAIGRRSGVAADTSAERSPQRIEDYTAAIADCREARRRLRQARIADLVAFQEALRCQGEALLAECTTALQCAYDFLLAEAFPPGRNVQRAARRVVLRVAELPDADELYEMCDAKGTQGSALTITVDDSLHYWHFLIEREYELYEQKTCMHLAAVLWESLPGLRPLYRAAIVAALGEDAWKPLAAHKEEALERALWLWERTAGCSRVERQSAVAYSVHHLGIDFTDEAALEALAAEAAVARRAAQEALDGAGNAEDEETASAGEQGWEEEGADTYGENGAEETDGERGAPEVEAASRRPLALSTPETTMPPVARRGYHQYRHGLDDFLTAQASTPHEAWRTAAQVLIHEVHLPVTWTLPSLLRPWMSVEEVVQVCLKSTLQQVHDALSDAGELVERVLRSLQHLTAAWQACDRAAVVVYCTHIFGVDFTDAGHMRAFRAGATAARSAAALEEEASDESDDTSDESSDDEVSW